VSHLALHQLRDLQAGSLLIGPTRPALPHECEAIEKFQTPEETLFDI
jgi:hypothetical protein